MDKLADAGESPLIFDQAAKVTPEPMPDELDVGNRVRALRKKRGWSLSEAADRFGIGRSTLAKIEAGSMSPTVGLLQKIAVGLETELTTLVARGAREPASGRLTITQAGRGEYHRTSEHVHEMLATGLARKKMVPFRSTIKLPRDGESQWYRHDAEEFVFVLEGQAELHSEHYAPKILNVGDSAYLDGRMAHRLVAAGDRDAVVLFIISA